ncbi:hypothetical protein GGQ22_14535 [Nocardioides sp. zg-579]|uniref:Uncharacterized protein n=1 Tax=Nocardioides marmotae TaxID=2663857 RepID=A0A6I3JDW1_9ACTN|nr:protein kinase family protein [Nocardioides marmotae]MCR6032643.1 hypothetical protein [Gordonia jinghuaiqii]MTB96291.1 hypothetical protein [Nocardioides marmotae]QKE03219.1 hypothetical protein HPC71_20765 [Nocardioides marmotae]
MPQTARPGDVLADRYRLVDLLSESSGGLFWRAHDRVLERHVALHVIDADDERAPGLIEAARRSATVLDRRVLRVLDAERLEGVCYVVNEWGSGASLDILLATGGPLAPRKAAWLVGEVADAVATSHAAGVSHGRLVPENVLVERTGQVKVIGMCVDAALHGLPTDGTATDVVDLAGLLYAALTGRWAGVSPSAVPAAPQEHGHVLRPRQVRAGVPRPLDALCEALLNPYAARRDLLDVTTARGVAAYLEDFVGDPTGMPEALAAMIPALHRPTTIVLPPVPEVLPHEREPDPAPRPGDQPDDQADPQPEDQPGPTSPRAELPTEAGLPIFDDEADDVTWLERRTDPVPPPPPFEEPPSRPLFAPEPADGAPVRRPRVEVLHGDAGPHAGGGGGGAPGDPSYWPWDDGDGRGTGSALPAVGEETEQLEPVPGRRWMRLAIILALCAAVLVATVVGVNLGRGRGPLGTGSQDPPRDASPSARALSAVPVRGVTDLDPQGGDGEENPDLVPLAADADPATAWRTATYEQQLGPGGLKTGVGIVLDLGSPQEVSEVGLTLVGAPTEVSVYVSDTEPTAVRDLTLAGSDTLEERGRVELEEPTTARYVVVWLTSLPAVDGGYRGEVAEVVVRG